MAQTEKQVFTIGHSTHPLEEFLKMLESFSIKTLVDVRSLPGSNKFPQYNQADFAASLKERGITYVYMKDLGGRRPSRKNSTNTIWRNKSFRGYADYMETEAFKKALNQLKALALKETTVYMCAEAVWWRCHRSMISDALKAEGWQVEHIMAPGKAVEHPYTKPATLVEGKLYYGPAEEAP